jgi:DNA-binding response OmpR family regulator
LKSNSKYANIAIILVTSQNDEATKTRAFEMGAVDFISKPFFKPTLLHRIKNHLDVEHEKETERMSVE